MNEKIKMAEPEIGEREKKYVLEALEEVELSGHGRHVLEFEKRFAEYCGVEYAVMVPNGTIAPHLAFMTLGIEPDDEIILPSQTISTLAFAVTSLFAKVVPCDVDPKTWTMAPNALKNVLSPNTKVVVPTPIFAGVMPDMDAIYAVIEEFEKFSLEEIYVVEDFAESIGSSYKGKKSGNFGDMGTCSLFANKSISTGEGGMITTNSRNWNDKLRYLRNCAYGIGENKFWAKHQGMNYRPHNLAACIGLGQLDNVDYLMKRRYDINNWYHKYLSDKFVWQEKLPNCECVPWMNAVLVPQEDGVSRKSDFMRYMSEFNIETRPLFPPIGKHPYLKNRFLVSEENEDISTFLWDNGVLLPSGGPKLTEEVVEFVCEKANDFLGR